MTTSRDMGDTCFAQSQIRMVETSRISYWCSQSIRGRLSVVLGLLLLPSYWAGKTWQQPVLGTLLCFAAIYQVMVWYAYRRSCTESTARNHTNTNSGDEVCEVYGDSSELSQLRELGDEVFEPYVVRYNTLWDHIPGLWVFILPAVSVVILTAVIWHSVIISTAAVVGVILTPVLAGEFLPCYYRISPGRLDRLVAGPFSTKTRCTCTISLTDARIVCRLDRDYVLITERKPGGALKIHLTGLSDPCHFVRKVLQGAMTKYHVIKLPNDALLG